MATTQYKKPSHHDQKSSHHNQKSSHQENQVKIKVQTMKQTDIGLIPEDWEVKTIGELSILINGRAYKQSELLDTGKYKVLRVGNFFSSDKWYWSDLELPNKNFVENGDLMYAWSASFGPKFWIGKKCIFHYHIWKIVPTEKVDKNFFYHFLENDKSEILKTSQGGTMIHITKGFMENKKMQVPPLSEQQKIAEALSDADAWIESLEALLAKKRLMKQGAMQQLLTPKEDWEEKKLGEIAEIYQPQTISQNDFTDDGFLVYGANGIVGKYKMFNHEHWQTTITCRGSTCGTVNRTVDKSWITGNAMVMNVDNNHLIVKDFFYYLLSNCDFSNCITGSGQPQIVRNPLRDFIVNIPTREEQTRIATILSDMDTEIESLEAQLAKARQLKQGMMQVLLTGRVRLV